MSIILESMTSTKPPVSHTAAGARYWVYNPSGKKTIIAIHGLRGTHHGLQFIAAALPEYRFIIPDLPGFGESKPLKGPHTTKNYIKWLSRFIAKLELKQKPVLLGHSFGSIISSHYAHEHGENITKLILINPISKHGSVAGALAAKSYYKLGRMLPEPLGKMLLRSKLLTRAMSQTMLTTKEKSLKKRVHEQHFAYFGTFANTRSVGEAFDATMAGSVTHVAPWLTMPVLLIVGARDKFVPLRGQTKLYKQIPKAQLHIIPQVGHLVHYETPEKAAAMIDQFLQAKS